MDFDFRTNHLEKLYTEEKDAHKYPPGVVDRFFQTLQIIHNIESERELYVFKGLRFEKLHNYKGYIDARSVRLNNQYRLIFTIESDAEGKYLYIIDLVDYH